MYEATITRITPDGKSEIVARLSSKYHSDIEREIRVELLKFSVWTPIRDREANGGITSSFATLTSWGEPLTNYYCAGRAVIAHDVRGRAGYRLVTATPAGMLATN